MGGKNLSNRYGWRNPLILLKNSITSLVHNTRCNQHTKDMRNERDELLKFYNLICNNSSELYGRELIENSVRKALPSFDINSYKKSLEYEIKNKKQDLERHRNAFNGYKFNSIENGDAMRGFYYSNVQSTEKDISDLEKILNGIDDIMNTNIKKLYNTSYIQSSIYRDFFVDYLILQNDGSNFMGAKIDDLCTVRCGGDSNQKKKETKSGKNHTNVHKCTLHISAIKDKVTNIVNFLKHLNKEENNQEISNLLAQYIKISNAIQQFPASQIQS